MGSFNNILQIKRTGQIFILSTILITLVLSFSIMPEDGSLPKIDNNFLRKHITQIKNPKLMTIEDFTLEYERNWLLEPDSSCSFVVKGDFNKDGYSDYAVVGKYDGPYRDKSIFIAILTAKENKIFTEFLYKHNVAHDRAFLCAKPGRQVEIKNIDKRFDVIIAGFSYGTDYLFAIVWNGKEYITTMPDHIYEK